jgi:hypothetical protein
MEPLLSTTLEGTPYLCLTHEFEQAWVQPLRLASGLVAGPLVVYASARLPEQEKNLALALRGVGIAMSAWSLWAWSQAQAKLEQP